jgi:hypothetical protein
MGERGKSGEFSPAKVDLGSRWSRQGMAGLAMYLTPFDTNWIWAMVLRL